MLVESGSRLRQGKGLKQIVQQFSRCYCSVALSVVRYSTTQQSVADGNDRNSLLCPSCATSEGRLRLPSCSLADTVGFVPIVFRISPPQRKIRHDFMTL